MAMEQQQRDVVDGTLTISSRPDGDTCVVSFRGEFDLANAPAAETELTAAMAPGVARLVIDIAGLEFIDSTGIAVLLSALHRCEGKREIRFVPSRSAAVNRVLSLTGVAERLPLLDGDSAD